MRKSIVILATLVLVFACKKNESATPVTTTQSTTTTVTTAAPAPQPAPATASAAPTTGAIAGTDGEKPGVHVDITELKRAGGGTVNLKFVISNSGNERLNLSSSYLGDGHISDDNFRDVSGVHLLDPVNKKKYFVVTDAEKKCVCSKQIPDIEPGAKLNLWAKFPAPPPDVTKVSIEIPHFAPIDDAPISQ